MDGKQPTLFALGDSDRTVADPAEDIRGRAIVDSDGDEIGEVDDLLIDDQEGRVRFLRVGEGGFLGMGKQHFLVPVDAVASVEQDQVRIDRQRSGLAEAPIYDPDLVGEPDYYAGVYGWWGYRPFW